MLGTMKKLKLPFAVSFAALIFLAPLFTKAEKANKAPEIQKPLKDKSIGSNRELETITKLASTIISKQHYRQHPLDDNMSAKLFMEYFKVLDPNKMFFTQKNIDSFKPYSSKLDDQAFNGDLTFAFEVYKSFLKRLELYKKYTDKLLTKKFDFSKDEKFAINRAEQPWAKSTEELEDIWRKKIKNEILTLRLLDRASKEKKETTKDKKTKAHSSWRTKSPEERIKKRIAHYVNYLNQNESIDVLELYLCSLARIYDPHSSYMAPRTEEDFDIEMKLSLVGIGALLSSEDGYTKIERLIPGGPAEKDGKLKPEDRIIAVAQDGKEPVDIVDMSLSKVVHLIRGEKGTKVYLTVLDGNKGLHAEPNVIVIERDTVNLKDREAKGKIETVKDKNGKTYKLGVITLPSFYMDFNAAFRGDTNYKSTTRDIKKILTDFNKEKIDGLIVDLRSNGGGSLTEAINLSGLFIKDGPVVQVKSSFGKLDIKYDEDSEITYNGPMLTLINRLSASAAEIFAGAIQDYKRGILVGDTRTHGKGIVQTIYDLQSFLAFLGAKFPAGSIKFTNAKFYRVNGSSTQIKGVTPDIVFPSFTDSMEIGEEHLDYALPWDSIKSVEHDYYVKEISKLIPKLKEQSLARRSDNKKFQLLEKDIEAYNRLRKRKTISLNEQQRWSEYQKEKEIQEEQKKLMKLSSDSSVSSKNKEPEDLYLNEGKNIMIDYINILTSEKAKQVELSKKTR